MLNQSDKANWIPTEWSHVDDLAKFDGMGIIIRRTVSPFYDGDKFAVSSGRYCLSKRGEMVYEPLPSSRTKAFYKRCRFDSFDDAVAAATKYAQSRAGSAVGR